MHWHMSTDQFRNACTFIEDLFYGPPVELMRLHKLPMSIPSTTHSQKERKEGIKHTP